MIVACVFSSRHHFNYCKRKRFSRKKNSTVTLWQSFWKLNIRWLRTMPLKQSKFEDNQLSKTLKPIWLSRVIFIQWVLSNLRNYLDGTFVAARTQFLPAKGASACPTCAWPKENERFVRWLKMVCFLQGSSDWRLLLWAFLTSYCSPLPMARYGSVCWPSARGKASKLDLRAIKDISRGQDTEVKQAYPLSNHRTGEKRLQCCRIVKPYCCCC